MKKIVMIIFSTIIGMGFICSNIPDIIAQEADEFEFTLEEITVTAQKREENLQKTPMTMDVVTSDDIKISGKTDLESILQNMSGISIVNATDGLRISIRGMSDDTSWYHGQQASTPTVAINMDGVYSNRKDTSTGLFDLERVEVLYGPQSTLYASNSPGGIVNIITANPKLDVYEGSAVIEVGNYSRLHTEGVINIPISDMIAIRTAVSTSYHDGYMANGTNDEDSKSARFKALFQPNDIFSFIGVAELVKSKNQSASSIEGFVNQDEVDDPWYTDNPVCLPINKEIKKVYGNISLHLKPFDVTILPAYTSMESTGEKVQMQSEGSDPAYYINEEYTDGDEKSLELRMTSSDDFFFKWIFGINYYKSNDILDSASNLADGTATGEWNYGVFHEEIKAAYGNITYPVTDIFRVTSGLRYSQDVIRVTREEMTSELDVTKYKHSYKDPDYKLGVEYDLSENSMFYADWSTSYRSQGIEGTMMGPASVKTTPPPEKLKAYTVGLKNRFLDNKLELNASGFFYDYKNYAVGENIKVYTGDDPENAMSNELVSDPNCTTWGDGTMFGFDLQTSTYITRKDYLNLSVSYLKTEWKELVFDYYYDWYDPDGGMGGTSAPWIPHAVDVYPLEDLVLTGKSMTVAPEWTIGASYKHTFNLVSGSIIESQIDTVYKTGYYLTWKPADEPLNYQEAYYKIDLSATYIHQNGNWTFSTYVRNLMNYADKQGYFGTPINQMIIGNPRTYGAVLSVRF